MIWRATQGRNFEFKTDEELKEEVHFDKLAYTLNKSIVTGTPRWGQRALSAISDFHLNAIVFMLEQGAIVNHDPENYKKDWRLALMAKIVEWMQENDSSFVPII